MIILNGASVPALMASTELLASLESLLDARSLGIGLWIGLGVLTLALIILSRTPWGQARPVSKCVVLSIFAHFLLFGYAYGTRLMMQVPVAASVDEIEVELLDEAEPFDPETEIDSQVAEAPWNEVAGSGGLDPQLDPPDALEAPERVVERETPSPLDEMSEDGEAMTVASSASMPQRPQQGRLEAVPFETSQSPIDASAIDRADPTRIEKPLDQPSDLLSLPSHSPIPRVMGAATSAELTQRGPGELDFDRSLQQMAESLVDPNMSYAMPGRDQLQPSVASMLGPVPNSLDQQASGAAQSVPPANQAATLRPVTDDARLASMALIERLVKEQRSRLGDGRPIPQPYRLRRADHRRDVALARGGTLETEQAVNDALAWLAANQEPNGRWDSSNYGGGKETGVLGHDRGGAGIFADTGVTGLALLAFLSAGHTHLEGDYRETVAKALSYLMERQESDGNLSGDALLYARMYCHGMALFALSEAYAMTGDHQLRGTVVIGIEYTVNSQHPSSGGWRYQPGDLGDMSQFGWQVMAIRSAQLAGIHIPAATDHGMRKFLADCSSGRHQGLAGYRPTEKPSATMTAEALVCRLLLESDIDGDLVREAQRFTADGLPEDGEKLDLYLMYYGTLSMFLAQGEAWTSWNQAMQNRLLPSQEQSGPNAGSWSPDSVWGGYGGRVYSTAAAALSLEVYYRYLPLYDALEVESD